MKQYLISWDAPSWATPNHTRYGVTITTQTGTILFNITTALSVNVSLPANSNIHVEVYAMDDLNNKTKVLSKDFTTTP